MEDRWTGRLLGGRFRVLSPLGRGGMAPVYEAENITIGRRVAIKILEPSARLLEPNARRFVREAKALARVTHPNVVSVLDIEEDRITSALFIVQELLEGSDLRAVLRRRSRLSVDETLAIMTPIGEAIEATHRASVVHADVTPANIFLAQAGGATVPKLIDFGLAQRIGRPSRSREGRLFGTPHYMAPEHARGQRLDARADVWSFGAVLYRCLAGHSPYAVSSAAELLVKIKNEPAPPLDELRAIPADLAAVVERALRPDRDERFTSMHELLRALHADMPLRAAG
jgi:serine/threonine protein kinase